MRVLNFDYVLSEPPYGSRSALDGSLEVREPWDAEIAFAAIATDLAGMTFDGSSETLLVLSQESSVLMRVEPDTGALLEFLSLSGSNSYEGVTLFEDCRLAVMAEPDYVELYAAGP